MVSDLSRLHIPDKEHRASSDGAPPQSLSPRLGRAVLVRPILVAGSILTAFILGSRWTVPANIPSIQDSPAAPNLQPAIQPLAAAAPSGNSSLAAVGYVVADRQAAVSSKATGRLKELRVREGDPIEVGEIIGILENDDLQAALAGAQAQHQFAMAQQEARRAERIDAVAGAARAARLYADKTLSVEASDAAQLRVTVAQASEVAAEASVAVAAAAVQRASAELAYTIIKAPFSGTVISKNAELGEIVAPFGSSATARAALVTIADLSSLLVAADISESAIMRVGIGTPCDVRLDAAPDKVHAGTIISIVPSVDRAKATVLAKIKLAALTHEMLPEMSAKITCVAASPSP